MRKALLALLLVMPLACGVSGKEATETLTALETLSDVEAATRTVVLGQLCSESKTCMGSCKEVLEALGSVAPQDRIMIVRQCDPNVKPPASGSEREAFDQWMVAYVGGYITKVRAALPEADRPRLDKAWAAIQK